MLNKILKTLTNTAILLAVTSNTLKADMMFYYSAAILPSIIGNKSPSTPIKPMVSFKDNAHGYEPWIVDIENNEAHMVKDINTNGADTIVRDMFVTISGITYFFADDGINGFGLWKTDGSEDGTVLVKNYHNTMLRALHMFEFKGKVHFQAETEEFGYQIWKSDGTSEGTECITKDVLNIVYPGLIVIGDTMYFGANGSAVYGNQLWKSDGTAEGIEHITNMEGNGADNLVNVNGTLYFRFMRLIDGMKKKYLYRTNGTLEGLEEFTKTHIGENIPLIHFKDKLLLFDIRQNSLKKFNGEEFIMVKDFGEGGSSSSNLNNITVTDNEVYFVTSDSVYGRELFRTDGTTEGTVLIEGLPLKENWYGNVPSDLSYMNNTLYFTYLLHEKRGDIWSVQDGNTTAKKLIDLPGIGDVEYTKVVNNLLYIVKYKSLFVSDGTEEGTVKLKEFKNQARYFEEWPYPYKNTLARINQCGNKACILQDDGVSGQELWSTSGTVATTELLKDINIATKNSVLAKFDFLDHQRLEYNAGAKFSPSKEYASINNKHIFIGRDGSIDSTLLDKQYFISDGTETGTNKVTINGTPLSAEVSSYGLFTKKDNFLYFIAKDDNHKLSLCKTDGKLEGTTFIKNIVASGQGSIKTLISHKGMLYFNGGSVLWKSDGTTEGTELIKDLQGESANDYVRYIYTSENEKIYIMMAYDSLWVSDGNSSNTVEIFKDTNIAYSKMFTIKGQTYFMYYASFPKPCKLYKVNNTVVKLVEDLGLKVGVSNIVWNDNEMYFQKNYSKELWKFSASDENTSLVKDNFSYASLAQFVNVNNTLFFVAGDETHGEELWKSDGTTAGTVMIKDITVGPLSSEIKILNVEGNKILFTVKNTEGLQLWVSDGTEAGTKVMNTTSN